MAREVYLVEGSDADRLIAALEKMERRTIRRLWRWELAKIMVNTVVVLAAAWLLWSALDRRTSTLEASQRALWERFNADAVTGGSQLVR